MLVCVCARATGMRQKESDCEKARESQREREREGERASERVSARFRASAVCD